MGAGTKSLNVYVINKGLKEEICTIKLASYTNIQNKFISNDFYKADGWWDYTYPTKLSNKELLSLNTYVLSNQKITPDIMNSWLEKNNTYNKAIYKTAYGIFLTGLTHMYLQNALTAVLEYALNITTYNLKNTQMCAGITNSGRTYVDIDDGGYGLGVIAENQTNCKLHTFINGFIGSYLESAVLRLAGDENAGSAAQYLIEDFYNNKTLNFTRDNQTGDVTIHTANNNDYSITLNQYSYNTLL